MNARAALLLGALVAAGIASCEDHDPVIVGHTGGMPNVDGGESLGRTDPVPWCDVNFVLECKCRRCHQDPPQNSAPFPLLSYDDTQAVREPSTRRVYQRMRDVIANDFMPPTFLPDLRPKVEMATEFEKATIIGWIDQGAIALGGTDCPAVDVTTCPKVIEVGGAGGEAGATGSSGASAGGGAGAGGAGQ